MFYHLKTPNSSRPCDARPDWAPVHLPDPEPPSDKTHDLLLAVVLVALFIGGLWDGLCRLLHLPTISRQGTLDGCLCRRFPCIGAERPDDVIVMDYGCGMRWTASWDNARRCQHYTLTQCDGTPIFSGTAGELNRAGYIVRYPDGHTVPLRARRLA